MTDNITLPRSVVEQALEALFMYKPMVTGVTFQHGLDAMQALRAALDQPVAEQPQDTAYREAVSLAKWLFRKHFAHEEHYASGRVVWEPCDTTVGVISQIDNMVCGLVRQQQGEQELEYWRPVVGFEGLYEVSSRGDIRNLKTNAVLAKNKMGAGYIKADLWKLGTRTQTSAHRIVAEAFLGNTKGLEVNHINGDKSDNRVSNLEIVTKNENESHSRYVLGNLVKPVIARNLTSGTEFEFKSVNAARAAGFLPSSVYKCCYGICKQHKGHSFRFKNPDHANGEKVSSATHPQPAHAAYMTERAKHLATHGIGG